MAKSYRLRRGKSDRLLGKKRKFIFRRDPRDISVIWFYDPEVRTHYAIPYRDTSHAAISLWELREAHKAAEAAVLMTVIESAKLCEVDLWSYLKDVLTKLPTWPNSRLGELLSHNWSKTNPPALST